MCSLIRKGRCRMSKEKKGGEFPPNRDLELLKIFEGHIWRKIREAVGEVFKRECFYDPRNDEMMSEIYPDD